VLIDRSKLQLFEVLEDQKGQIVNEKILRCEAEFAREAILSSADVKTTEVHKDARLAEVMSQHGSYAPSDVRSAPAVLAPLVPKEDSACMQGSGDCLPPHAMVWTEGGKLPQLLSTLQAGERIMCYDNLSKSMTYAKIEKLENSTNTEWVQLSLEDGSTLEVTTDHPLAVQPEFGSLLSQKCMRAGELRPGRDRLMMLKMVWVPISDVRHFSTSDGREGITSAECPESRSITISVEQKERHEIFVTTGDKKGTPGHPIAVGSSDRSMDFFGSWRKKNTFVHFQTHDKVGLKRSNSDPALKAPNADPLPVTSSIGTATLAMLGSSIETSTTTDSICSSKLSESDDRVIFKIGRAPYDDSSSNVASLAELFRLKANGTPSFGSEHPAHMCRSPCSFQFAGLVNAGRHCCTAGALCEYCHDTGHQTHMSSKLRKLSRLPKHLAKMKNSQIRKTQA
jgi:hypothetical protein